MDDQGVIRWQPATADVGEWEFNVVAKDALGAGTQQRYPVAVADQPQPVDQPPVITSTPIGVAAVRSVGAEQTTDYLYRYHVKATDPDNDDSAIGFDLVEYPAGMTIVSDSSDGRIPGQIEWQPELVHLGGQTAAYHWVTVVADPGADVPPRFPRQRPGPRSLVFTLDDAPDGMHRFHLFDLDTWHVPAPPARWRLRWASHAGSPD